MSQTLTTFASALRNVYQDEIREQVNDLNLFKKIRKQRRDELKLQGNGFIVVLHSSRNYAGVMSTGESGILGAAGNQGVASLTIPFRDIKGRFGITREAIEATGSAKGAVTPALEYEKQRLVMDIERQLNRQFWGYGVGTLGVIGSGTTSTTQTLINPAGVTGTTNPARFVQPGMVIAFQTAGVINNVKTVTAVNASTGALTVASITTTTNDIAVLGSTDGTNNNSSYNKEIMGLNGIVDGTTYVSSIFGLDRSQAANAFFKSGVVTSAGAFTEDLIYRKIQDQWVVSGQKITDFFCGPELVREYIKVTQPDRRYTGADLRSPDAGVKGAGVSNSNDSGLAFSGIPLTVDKDAPYGSLFGVCLPHLYVAYMNEGEWDTAPGGELRFVSNKTDYEAIYYMFLNMYSDQGNAHFRIDGFTVNVSAGVVAD